MSINPFGSGKVDLHVPAKCSKCGAKVIYSGVGEYQCESCKNIEYDDYGLVRSYLEIHQGATIKDVEADTGVSKEAIRRLLDEDRIAFKPYK